ncbi:MAG: SEC-C domain-containing protein [Clostridium sp.]|nr:SEC-C domain-containing protein [Clostridium sp.]
MLGRNDKCHCGSGKKYKKCCMDNTMYMRKNGINLFMYGNGPKAPMDEIEKNIREHKERISSVDSSKIEEKDGMVIVPTEYIGIGSNGAIEMFIGYAKREDTTEEEVKKVYSLVKEVVELDCKVFKMSPMRIKYMEELEVLIKDKNAKIDVFFISDEQLIDSFDSWFRVFGKTRPISDFKVTILDVLEGQDTIIKEYKDKSEKMSIAYMNKIFDELGYEKNLETLLDSNKKKIIQKKLNAFDSEFNNEYYNEVKKKLNINI